MQSACHWFLSPNGHLPLLLRLLIGLLLLFLLHPGRFSECHYETVEPLPRDSRSVAASPLPALLAGLRENTEKWGGNTCPHLIPLGLNSSPPLLPGYSCLPGGHCSPPSTSPQVTVIIPYRDRSKHASILLPYLHTFLQLQGLHYRLFLVEQSPGFLFNRGKLLNVGFLEAQRLEPGLGCLVFHDVDLLPLHLATPYTCLHRPLHLSAHLDEFRFLLPYSGLVGGVLAITADQFVQVNGFSNNYFGWGGEDDDLYQRLDEQGLLPLRLPPRLSHYTALRHPKQVASSLPQAPLPGLQAPLDGQQAPHHGLQASGLSNISYTLRAWHLRPMVTHLLVDL